MANVISGLVGPRLWGSMEGQMLIDWLPEQPCALFRMWHHIFIVVRCGFCKLPSCPQLETPLPLKILPPTPPSHGALRCHSG